MFRAILVGLIWLTSGSLWAQTDSLAPSTAKPVKVKKHTGRKAAIRSAILPGWGQLYNKKYWKLPIVYGGLGVTGYIIGFNLSRVNAYSSAYVLMNDDCASNDHEIGDVLAFDENAFLYDDSDLLEIKELYRRYLDISVIVGTLIYVLNIIDASVDGHLYEFDVSDDLSIWVQPNLSVHRQKPFAGLTLSLRL